MATEEMTLRKMWADTTESVGAQHEARWLCEVAAALDGGEFDAALDEVVTDRMVSHLDSMLARIRTGEPLQYVLGRWAFRGIDLAIDRRVLIPRPETEMVAGLAIELCRSMGPPRLIADLGTGSGAIGLSLAQELPLDGTTIWITDESDDALDVARSNLAGLGRAARNVRSSSGPWFDALPTGERFDLIVSNPPYVAAGSTDIAESVAEWEPSIALFSGDDGLDDVRKLIDGGLGWLRPGGWLVLEIGYDQGDRVQSLYGAAGYVEVDVRPDLAGLDRIAVGRSPLVGEVQ